MVCLCLVVFQLELMFTDGHCTVERRVKLITTGGWYVFVHCSLNVPNCAIKSQLPLIDKVELTCIYRTLNVNL